MEQICSAKWDSRILYSEIPLLRPPNIKVSYLLETLFAKFKLFFSSFSTPSVHLIGDHLWDCPKVVLKTTFGQSQRGFDIGILLYLIFQETYVVDIILE